MKDQRQKSKRQPGNDRKFRKGKGGKDQRCRQQEQEEKQPARIEGCRGLYFTKYNPNLEGKILRKPDGSEIKPIELMDYRRRVSECTGSPFLWMPELFTIDKAFAALLLILELEMQSIRVVNEALVRPEKGHEDYGRIAEYAEKRLAEGALPVDVDTVKYNETHYRGIEMLSASHFVATSLGLKQILKNLEKKHEDPERIKRLRAYLDLLEIINRHNQSGYLKAGSHALPYLMREAKKIWQWMQDEGEDEQSEEFEYQGVIMRSYHALKTWIDAQIQDPNRQISYPDWIHDIQKQYSNELNNPWTVGDYIQNMYRARIPKDIIEERAMWWNRLQELVLKKNEQRKAEVDAMLYADLSDQTQQLEELLKPFFKEEVWVFKKFYFGHQDSDTREWSHTGLLIRHDNEDHVRACWGEGVALIIVQKSNGQIAIMTSTKKRVDLGDVFRQVQEKLGKGFFERKINAIFVGGTGNWSGETPENVPIEDLQQIVEDHVRVPNPFAGEETEKKKRFSSRENLIPGTNRHGLEGMNLQRLQELQKKDFTGKNWGKPKRSRETKSNPIVIHKNRKKIQD